MSSILLEVEFGDVGFYDKRKTREPDEKPSEQEREPTTNSTHIWQRAGIKLGPHFWTLERIPHCAIPAPLITSDSETDIYILLTKHEGRTLRTSARGLDRTQRGPYKKDQGQIFFQYGPEEAWLIRDLLHD